MCIVPGGCAVMMEAAHVGRPWRGASLTDTDLRRDILTLMKP